MKRIHIIGMGPRTGTTLMAEAMKACFEIDYSTDHEDRLFVRAKQDGEVFLTKHPADMFVVGPSLKVDPDLWIICMVRDPRDAIVSRHTKDKTKFWAGLRYWKAFYPIYRSLKRHPRFVTVRYEDFVSAPDTTQKALEAAIPVLRKKHDFSKYHEVSNVSEESKKALLSVRPISPVGIGSWRKEISRVKQQCEIHGDITNDLQEFGYEQDGTWKQELEGVEAFSGESHYPEFFTEADLKKRHRKRYLEATRRLFCRFGLIPKRWPKSTQV